MSDDERLAQRTQTVSQGIFLIMRGAGKMEGEDLKGEELSEDDKAAVNDIATGLIRIWDGLTS
jgi:hypothetical protein